MPLRWLRANDLLAVREEMTRCRGSPLEREFVKSESWVHSFGEIVLPANSGDFLVLGRSANQHSANQHSADPRSVPRGHVTSDRGASNRQ